MSGQRGSTGAFFTDVDGDRSALQRYQTLVNTIDDGLYQLDTDGRFVALNDVVTEVTGYERGDLLGEHVSTMLTEDDAARAEAAIRALLESDRETVTLELPVRTAHGGVVPCEFRLSVLVADGEFEGTVGVVRDAGDREQRERDPASPTSRYESPVDDALDGAGVGVLVTDAESEVAWVNEAVERYFGLDRESTLGRDQRSLLEGHFREVVADDEAFVEAIRSTYGDDADPTEFECRVLPGDGREERWLEHRSKPLESGRYAGGRVELYYDVTERKRSDRAPETTEQRYARLVDNIPGMVYRCRNEPEWSMEFVSDGCTELTGHDPVDVESGTVGWDEDVVHPEDREDVEETVRAGLDDGETFTVQYRVLTTDGETRWVWERGRVADGPGDSLPILEGVITDITGQKWTEQALREKERQLREETAFTESLLDVQADLVYAFDEDGQFLRWNERVPEVTGYSDDELAEMDPTDLVAEDATDRATDAIEAVLEERQRRTIELPLETADGDRIPYEFSGAPITDEDGTVDGVTGIGRDVSDRKERERGLRQERDLNERLLEAAPASIVLLAPDGRVVRANERAKERLGFELDEAGNYVDGDTDVYDENGDWIPPEDRPYFGVFETGEPVTDWHCQIDLAVGRRWMSINAIPVQEDGDVERVIVTSQDITKLKEQARQLERRREELEGELETVFERVDGAFYAVDEQFRYTYVNERAEELLQAPEEELLGESVWEQYPEAKDTPAWDAFHDAMETQEPTSYEVHFEPLGFWVEANVYPSETGLSVYFRDVTERVEREHELEHYETLARTASDVIVRIDTDSVVRDVNPAVAEVLGYEPEELVGESVTTLMPDELAGAHREAMARYLDGEERHLDWEYIELPGVRADGTELSLAISFSEYEHGDERYFTGIIRDITERKERERELARYEHIVETIWDGVYALDEDGRFVMVNEAFCEMTGFDREELLAEPASVIHSDGVSETASEMAAERQGDRQEPAVLEVDLRTADDGTVPIEARFGPYEHGDGRYGRAGVVRDISDRLERERELERQRERLATLNHLNDVVREITDAVIDQSTREEIERTVCEALASTDAYEFAWVGDVNTTTGVVESQVEAGVDGYTDDIDVSADSDDPTGRGPTGRAVQTGEMQVVRNVTADGAYEPWRQAAREYGFRASAAIPIIHEGTLYGVLNVYADRAGAFADEERGVVGQLGEVVGHAIAAVERKRALMSDEVIELDFLIEDVFEEIDVQAATQGQVVIEETVPVGGDEYLIYGTADEDGLALMEAIVETVPHWEELRAVGEGVDQKRFEVQLTEPPVLTALASRGGDVQEAYIEDGDYEMTVQLPPGVDVRGIVDAVTDAYPTTELRAQRQVSRSEEGSKQVASAFQEKLTDRQRSVVETAYYAGYFEWPRESSGEELAESLDIAPATFSQHLRRAQNHIFGALFGNGS